MNSTEICKLCTGTFVIAFAFAASSEALAAKPIQRDDLRAPEIVEIQNDKNVYRVGDRVWSLYYITKDGVVVIDPCGKRIAERMAQLIKEKTNLPVKYVIYSHNHWDHIAGAKVFMDQGATIIAHELAAKNIREGNPDVVAPDWIWAGDKKTLSIGGQDIEMTYFGYKSQVRETWLSSSKTQTAYTPLTPLCQTACSFNMPQTASHIDTCAISRT